MKNIIDGRLGIMRQFVIAAGSVEKAFNAEGQADCKRLVKAFRLKHFSRCPRCDEPMLWVENVRDLRREYWCEGCGFAGDMPYLVQLTRDTDELVLEMVEASEGGDK